MKLKGTYLHVLHKDGQEGVVIGNKPKEYLVVWLAQPGLNALPSQEFTTLGRKDMTGVQVYHERLPSHPRRKS